MTTVGQLVADGALSVGDGYRAKNSELLGGGPEFIRAAEIDGIIGLSDQRLSPAHVAHAGEKAAQPGDVVLTTKGTVGRTAFVTDVREGLVYSPQLSYWRVRKSSQIHPRYLYYWLNSPRALEQLRARQSQTDMAPYVSLRDQASIEIDLPDLGRQRGISEVLGALDDKIDLNRRTNQTIQHLLHALFTQMPEDERAPIGELARVVGGSTPSTGELAYWSGGKHAWATPKDLAALSDPVLTRTARMITDAGLARVSSGLLPLGTVLLSSRAPIGYLAVSEIAIAVNQGFIAMVPNGTVSSLFLLQWAQSHLDDIKARANGTTFLEISKANFRPMMVNLPSQSDRDRFDGIARPMHSLMVANVRENQALAGLRDALLPELISGRMTVRDAAAAG